MFEKIKVNFIQFILNKPKMTLLIGFVLFLGLTSGGNYIKSNYTPRIWFDNDYPAIVNLDNFEKRFGGDQFLAVGYYTKKNLLGKDSLNLIKKLTDELWLLPDIIRVDSLSNFNNVEALDNDINIVPLIPEELNDKTEQEVLSKIKNLDEIKNYLISNNYEYTILYAQMKPLFGSNPNYTHVVHNLKEILQKYKTEDNRFILMGNVAVTYAFREISNNDNKKTIPFMAFFIFIMLVLFFRSFSGVVVPLVISLVTIGSTFGIMGHLDIVYNSILAAIPGVLLAICLADTVHIMSTFYNQYYHGNSIRDSLEYSLKKNFLATILTTLTTAISFYTISFTDLVPIYNLGTLASIGTLLAWINTYLFLPPVFLLLPEKFIKKLWGAKVSKKAEESRFSSIIMKFKYPIIISFIFISIGSFILALQNEVNSDPLKYFDEHTEIKKDYNFTKEYIEGVRGIELEIDSGSNDGIKDPQFLQKVQTYIDTLLLEPEIVQVNSILNPIMKVNQQLNGGNKKYYQIPDNKEQVAESLFLYTMGLPPGQGIENFVSMDNRYLRLSLKWTIESTKESMEMDTKIHKMADKMGLTSMTGGFFPIYVSVNSMVVDSFFKSMTMALVLVSLIILFVFKDPFLAFLSMLPNIIPLLFGAAFMALNHIYIDIGTSIVSAICLGIAVDDTIHFVAHYVDNKKKYGDTFRALNETFLSTGKALILTTLLLVVGFGSFVMAEFLPNHYFGILCAIVLTFALLTDLLFLPAILVVWYGKDKPE